jgi:hypothetical protein
MRVASTRASSHGTTSAWASARARSGTRWPEHWASPTTDPSQTTGPRATASLAASAQQSGHGTPDLKELGLEQERIEIPDAGLEALVAQGKVVPHGFEETFKLMNRRATKVLLVVAGVRYKTVDAEGKADVITTVMPHEMLPGSMAAPSFASNIIMEKVGKGLPLFRLEESSRVTASASTVARLKGRPSRMHSCPRGCSPPALRGARKRTDGIYQTAQIPNWLSCREVTTGS